MAADSGHGWIDISWAIQAGMVVFPGDPQTVIQPASTIENEGFSVHSLGLSTHTGTHVDAPAHFFPQGLTVERIPLDLLCGQALVADARAAGRGIGLAFLESLDLRGVERLLLRTENERYLGGPFNPDYAHLEPDAAHHLVSQTSVRLVGIDYLSIEGIQDPDYPVHRTLLGATEPVFILEGLNLAGIAHGTYDLICLPLPILNGDAAPCRAALRPLSTY